MHYFQTTAIAMCEPFQGGQDKGVGNIGSTYDIRGWVRTARNQKTFSFLEVCCLVNATA